MMNQKLEILGGPRDGDRVFTTIDPPREGAVVMIPRFENQWDNGVDTYIMHFVHEDDELPRLQYVNPSRTHGR